MHNNQYIHSIAFFKFTPDTQAEITTSAKIVHVCTNPHKLKPNINFPGYNLTVLHFFLSCLV